MHTYLGQEAIAAGVCACLDRADYLTSTHRGHGHAIAKGMASDVVMAELYGKATGANKGRGGSMHVADFALGMLGANGIVGGGFGIAAGAGLSAVQRRSGQVVVCFFGDGATNKGSFHEALNFAGVRRLPVVFVCENNQYAQFTAISRTSAVEDVAMRAGSYGFAGFTIDGNDVGAVFGAAAQAVAGARRGEGPTLLNCITYRHGGHYVGDPESYRDATEVDEWRRADPIERLERAMVDGDVADAAALAVAWAAATAEVDEAIAFAEASPAPDPSTALDFVYTAGVS